MLSSLSRAKLGIVGGEGCSAVRTTSIESRGPRSQQPRAPATTAHHPAARRHPGSARNQQVPHHDHPEVPRGTKFTPPAAPSRPTPRNAPPTPAYLRRVTRARRESSASPRCPTAAVRGAGGLASPSGTFSFAAPNATDPAATERVAPSARPRACPLARRALAWSHSTTRARTGGALLPARDDPASWCPSGGPTPCVRFACSVRFSSSSSPSAR